MKTKKILLQLSLVVLITFGCNGTTYGKNEQKSPELAIQTPPSNETKNKEESDEEKRFYELTKNLQPKYEAGKIEEVKSDISEIEHLLPNFVRNWNYGNAVHKTNIVKGRIALQNGDVQEAKKYLLLAGKTKGSPQLNSFGPNMSLAKELLEKGEKKAVLQYFDLCSVFWKRDFSKLGSWKEIVQRGGIPEFGANLIF